MKHLYFYLMIVCACLLSSCHSGRSGQEALPLELVQAENLMYEHPDSALQILQGMVIPSDKEAHATWALLLTQAKYKCDVAQSDSLVNDAYDYFIKGDDAQKKALSLFCKAGLLEEKNNVEDALNYYLEAVKVSENIEDYRLKHLIYVRLAILYAHRRLYNYAIEYCEMANQYALLSKDGYYIANSYNNLARVYSVQHEYDYSINFYNKAIEMGKAYNEVNVLDAAFQEKAGIYILQKKYNEALSSLKNIELSRMDPSTYQVLGHLYSKTNQIDSAYHYINKAIETDDIYVKRSAYQVLFNLSKSQKDYEKNAEYSVKLWNINDSINKIASNKALIEMQEKYDQQKVINEKNEAERKGLIILFSSIGLIALIVMCYQWKVLRQNKELEAKRHELHELKERLNENLGKIARNEERMETLAQAEPDEDTEEARTEKEKAIVQMQQQNEALEKENRDLLAQMAMYEVKLKEKSKDAERLNHLTEQVRHLHKRETYLVSQLLRKDDMIASLKKVPDNLKSAQWEELKERTDAIYDKFTERLMSQVPTLTEHDLHICCLIKLSFTHVEMADILGISPTSVSRQKLRLKERIIQQIGPFEDNMPLDVWLKEF